MKTLVVNQKTIVSIALIVMSFCFIAEETYSEVSISEIMYGSEIRFSPKQWIEIANSGTETVDLTGWTLTIQNVDSEDLTGPVTAIINFRDATFDDAPRIWANDVLMIVTSSTNDNSGGFMEDQVYDLRWREDLGIGFNTIWLSAEGFHITLTDKDGNLVDEVGNYDGNTTLWDLPYSSNRGRTREGYRTSLIRRYSNSVALDGTLEDNWISAADANLTEDQRTYYGDKNDISTPGIGIINFPATVRVSPATVASPATGQQLTISLEIEGGSEVAGYQATVQFDDTALRYVASSNGTYLPDGAFFAPPTVDGNSVTLNATSLAGETGGDGTLAIVTFEVIAAKASTLTLSDALLVNSAGESFTPILEDGEITAPTLDADINSDGSVNIQDLVLVASNLGQTGENVADANGDGIVNIIDLVLVAGALGTSAAAPSLHPQALEMLTATEVKRWLSAAQQSNLTDTTSLKGIRFLKRLLAAVIPKETTLLANYPNPFNPETWIPYQLSKPAEVRLHIYAVNGTLVRTLALGHQPVGMYQSRSRAAYWDGRNALGEPVASGVYFYTLTAGDYSATRKMLIKK